MNLFHFEPYGLFVIIDQVLIKMVRLLDIYFSEVKTYFVTNMYIKNDWYIEIIQSDRNELWWLCLLNLSSLLFIERNYKSLNLSSLLFIERKWRLCNKDKPIYLLHLSQQNVVALSRMQRFMIKYSMSQLPSLSRGWILGYFLNDRRPLILHVAF